MMLPSKLAFSITQELGWGSEDWDVSLPQKFSNSLCNLVRGHVSHDVFWKVIAENPDVHHVW